MMKETKETHTSLPTRVTEYKNIYVVPQALYNATHFSNHASTQYEKKNTTVQRKPSTARALYTNCVSWIRTNKKLCSGEACFTTSDRSFGADKSLIYMICTI